MSETTLQITHKTKRVLIPNQTGRYLLISEAKLKRLLKDPNPKKLEKYLSWFNKHKENMSIIFYLPLEYNIFKVLNFLE